MTARLEIRVMPRSRADALDGLRDSRLVVRVTAAPADGAANAAVVRLIAAAAGVPKSAVSIVRGAAARNKTVEVAGLDAAALRARLC